MPQIDPEIFEKLEQDEIPQEVPTEVVLAELLSRLLKLSRPKGTAILWKQFGYDEDILEAYIDATITDIGNIENFAEKARNYLRNKDK